MRKTAVAAAFLLAGMGACGARAATPQLIPPYLASALADPSRGDTRQIDARRKPAELLAFSGAKPGDAVVDLIPGSGYFTTLFAKVVGPAGHVYAIWPAEYAKVSHPDPENIKALAARPGFQNVAVLEQPAASFTTPQPVDIVFTSQNYHDYPDKFMGFVDPVTFDRAVFKALKPGGVFVIVDHVAEAGSGMRDTETRHRIDPAIVKSQVASAGFVFDGQSDALRNPADDHRRPVFDPTIRGHTDQFIFRFRKPG